MRLINLQKNVDIQLASSTIFSFFLQILEESPCKRWSKRCEKVKQRDVPGIDAAYLAMDNETGNEVVWNEVLFSERKNLRDQEVFFVYFSIINSIFLMVKIV